MARRGTPLRRKPELRAPRRKFILLTEGKNTEPDYFRAIRSHFRGALIEIELVPAVGTPMTIANEAVQRKRDLRRGARGASWQLADEVWAVFDRDEHPNVEAAINLCRGAGVSVAFSNPCFELWLILHHEAFGRLDDRHAVQKHFATLCESYDPGGTKRPDCAPLMAQIEAAEARADQQRKQRLAEGDEFGRPMTTVSLLTAAIRAAATSGI